MLGFVIIFMTSALWPNLPHYSLIGFTILVLCASLYFRVSSFLNGVVIGFLWASFSIHYYLDAQIDTRKFNQNVIITGEVDSLIHYSENNTDEANVKFNFIVHTLGNDEEWMRPKIRLSWYQPSLTLQQGQQFRLFIRLKAPIGLANPDGFNYQTWLTSQNIAATGYVKASPSNRLLKKNISLRQSYVQRLRAQKASHLSWLLALTYGDRSLLTQADWEVMQNTGTAHLFAISGMHLGIVFGFVFVVFKILLYLPAKYFSQQVSSTPVLLLFACCVSIFYAYIAGFQIPVMRALLAILIGSTIRVMGLSWRITSVFLVLLVCFFVFFPYAHLSVSFWFSFTAVILIWWFVWRFPISQRDNTLSKIRQGALYGLRLQLFLSFLTLPIIVSVFAIVPFTGFLANLVMIPLVTFVLVPLCLINAIFIALDKSLPGLTQLLDWLFEITLQGLHQVSALGSISASGWSISLVMLVCTYVVLLVLLLPASQYRIKTASIVIFIFGTFTVYFSSTAPEDEWELLAFDVGQGTSIVVRQQQQFMIYDTGSAFKGGFSMAQAVLMPYFNRLGMPKIDYLVLSHLDNDHAGGAYYLENNMQINHILSPRKGCNAYQTSQWQKLQMQILWPLSPQTGDENNHSCVIKLSSKYFSVLLAGDIEKSAEASIIQRYQGTDVLNADILIAPHHGSKTSSTQAFVNLVSPNYVIFTAGYNNRWSFPDQGVQRRYIENGAVALNTGHDGRIQVLMNHDQIEVSRYRQDEYPRWYFRAKEFNVNKLD